MGADYRSFVYVVIVTTACWCFGLCSICIAQDEPAQPLSELFVGGDTAILDLVMRVP